MATPTTHQIRVSADDAYPVPQHLDVGTSLMADTEGSDGGVHTKVLVGTDPVSGANPLPVEAAALPLPTGAATAAKQDSILTALAALATAAGLSTVNTSIANVATNINTGNADLDDIRIAIQAVQAARAVPPDTTRPYLRVRGFNRRFYGSSSTVAPNEANVRVNATSDVVASSVAPTTAFFNGADAGFGTSPRYIYGFFDTDGAGNLVDPAASASIQVINALTTAGVPPNLTLELYGVHTATQPVARASYLLDTYVLGGFQAACRFTPYGAGAGGSAAIRTVRDLGGGLLNGWILKVTPDADPTGGQMIVSVTHSAL